MDMSKLGMSAAQWAAKYFPARMKQAVYRYPSLANLIRGRLNRVVPSGLTDVTLTSGKLAGMHMRLDLQTEKDYWLGTYEMALQEAVAELVEPGMTVYDVGANVGFVTLLMAQCVGENGRVYAFEALPSNLERLRETLALNGLEPRVEIIPKAVIDRGAPIRFHVGPSGGTGKVDGSAGRQNVTYEHTFTVEGISLDEFVYDLGNRPPQVIKLDIEGGEVLALPGMRRLLQEAHPTVMLELHGPQAASAAWNTLTTAGYLVYSMERGFPPVNSVGALEWKAYLVALREN